jgi:hypothetical protein
MAEYSIDFIPLLHRRLLRWKVLDIVPGRSLGVLKVTIQDALGGIGKGPVVLVLSVDLQQTL